ncbi:hypothetical protein DFP73DRAFT_476110 [Morchella snyderi]|nr:hypothetical protein DFP73DRAFT_476110 [Morchella snyderi]
MLTPLSPPYSPDDPDPYDPHESSKSLLPREPRPRLSSSPAPASLPKSLWARVRASLYSNRGILLVLISQFFGSVMNLATRILETSFPEQRFHALQILFARQSITCVLVWVWLWWMRVPDAPWGPRGVRWLLVARGVGGFWGVFGLYYSLSYLDLSDATVITFLAPIVATFACSLIPSLREPFTRAHLLASLVSLLGVVLIARPTSLFTFGRSSDTSYETVPSAPTARSLALPPSLTATPHQRLIAVLVALLGVLGAASAFTTIRWIGTRAHPLLSVHYFSSWCALVSLVALLAVPSVGGIVWPSGLVQWALLGGIGVSGFVMQFLLTKGLQVETAGRATGMVYAQMVFAVGWERLVWGSVPGVLSVVGSVLILGSVVWVGMRKGKGKGEEGRETGGRGGDEEAVPLGRWEESEDEGAESEGERELGGRRR